MAKATLLISGANRGLGLEMARQFTADGWEVHGTVRRPGPSVSELASTIAPQRIHLLEAADPNSVAQLAANLRRIPFDAVFANAGMTGDTRKRPDEISFDDIAEVFAVNTFGALSLVRALKPNLLAGRRKLALAMSSGLSSLARNDWGDQYIYRASKTGLNALWRTLSVDWRKDGISCVLLRPGLVRTELSEMQGMDPAVSVAGLLSVVNRLSFADTGRLISYEGGDFPW